MPSFIAKRSMIQKTQVCKTFKKVLNHHSDLDLEETGLSVSANGLVVQKTVQIVISG